MADKIINARGEEVILNEGEMICDHCGGSGIEEDNIDPNANYIISPHCNKCKGHGKVDWISNATGVDEPLGYFSFSDDISISNTIEAKDIYIDGKTIIDFMSQKIAEEVDKKIMEIFGSTLEQKIKNQEQKT
jgi:hypothetical protein